MKKLSFVVCSAFAALMFVACSDDPVTAVVPPAGGGAGQGGGTVLDSTRNMSLNLKGCYGHPYDALMKIAADNPKAYLVVDEAGYHVVILNITDACGYASVVFNNQRVLDTLKVQFDGSPTDCMCLTDEWFTIDPLDADIKYFATVPGARVLRVLRMVVVNQGLATGLTMVSAGCCLVSGRARSTLRVMSKSVPS